MAANRVGKYAAFDSEDDLVKYVNTWLDPEKIVCFTVLREWITESVIRVNRWHNQSEHVMPWAFCKEEPCEGFKSDSLPILDDF